MLNKLKNIQDIIKLVDKVEIPDNLTKVNLDNAVKFIQFVNGSIGKRITVDDFQVLAPWAILLLASMSRTKEEHIYVENNGNSTASKFAYSLGLDEVLSTDRNRPKAKTRIEINRTVKLCELTNYEDIEPISEKISKLIIADYEDEENDIYFEGEEVRKTIKYVLVELMRNVIQHSFDNQGALVIAQKDKENKNFENSFIQIAVADRGIGIFESLKANRDIQNAMVALERSILAGYSGKFPEFETGTAQNAGMGLFFVSEIAKLTCGEFFISSRGASLYIKGDPNYEGNNEISISPTGYLGTLVVFEMPKRGVADYDSLIRKIQKTASIRRNKRHNNHWVRFDIPREKSQEFFINVAAEDTVKAQEFAETQLIPRIKDGEVLLLNFTNIKICTQSFMHALLFQALKTAFEMKIPLYATKVEPTIIDSIKSLEDYAL